MLGKLFFHSLKDDALKWYFTILEKSVDSYIEDLIHLFVQNFKYNIIKQTQYKDLCKIKQLNNKRLTNFIKFWKTITHKITTPKEDLKDAFTASLFP